jgi:hypothetical protein
VCFIYIALYIIWHTSFSCLSAQTEQYVVLISGNDHPWICWYVFVWSSHYQLLLLLPTPLDITYKTLNFVAAWQLFKCGILTLPDYILYTGSPLLHMVSHFTGIVNNIQCLCIRARMYCSLFWLHLWSFSIAHLGLAECGLMNLAWFSFAHCTQIKDDFTYSNTKFNKQTLSCIRVNTVFWRGAALR